MKISNSDHFKHLTHVVREEVYSKTQMNMTFTECEVHYCINIMW